MDNIDGDISMQSAGSGDAMSPQHFIVEKGLSDARGELDARVQVLVLPKELCLLTDHKDFHPLLLLSSTPGSKLVFSTNTVLHSSSIPFLPPT